MHRGMLGMRTLNIRKVHCITFYPMHGCQVSLPAAHTFLLPCRVTLTVKPFVFTRCTLKSVVLNVILYGIMWWSENEIHTCRNSFGGFCYHPQWRTSEECQIHLCRLSFYTKTTGWGGEGVSHPSPSGHVVGGSGHLTPPCDGKRRGLKGWEGPLSYYCI